MASLHTEYAFRMMDKNEISTVDKKIRQYIDGTQRGASFDEAIKNENDWHIFYQLSSGRWGVLDWYEFKSGTSVLEVDAGFGPLTERLCVKCSHVTATERSVFRAEGMMKRCEHLDNLDIYVGDVSEISFIEKFDYVVVVGLPERMVENALNYLRKLKCLLKEDGKLLLGVENRFGLKYFCGAVDTNTGKAFGGINQYDRSDKGSGSFGKKELQEMIGSAGFSNCYFYYPVPDYKFPQGIFSDRRLPTVEEVAKIKSYNVRRDTLVAQEDRLYADIVANGLFPFMANSFLIECSVGDDIVLSKTVNDGEKQCGIFKQAAFALPAQWYGVDAQRIKDNALRLESEEEKIANYQVSDVMKKTWKVELEMLDEIDRICKKYGLTYFLVHGSLLGAVRHKGFIPWDDDLDIAMLRADYDRFIEVVGMELPTAMSIHTPETEQDMFWGNFARLRNEETTAIEIHNLEHVGNQGIFVDILPLDVCVEDEKKLEKKTKRIYYFQRLIYAKIYGKEYKAYAGLNRREWFIYRLLARIYGHTRLCKKLNQVTRMYTEENTRDVTTFSGLGKFRKLSSSYFEKAIEMEFAGRKVPVPINYHGYLFATMGGDYMQYPPESERKPKHKGILDPNVSYVVYRNKLCDIFKECKGKQIVLFGAGIMFENYMERYGAKYRPAFLVDNDENKWGRYRMGIEVRKPEELLKIPESKRKLIICSYYYDEIERQLHQMGITKYQIYVQELEWIVQTEGKRG